MGFINAKQKALNDVLKKFTEMVDTGVASLANPDSVKRYLNSRIESAVPRAREFNESGINVAIGEVKTVESETINPEVLFNESSLDQVLKTEYEQGKKSFEATEKKFKQFNENAKALEELIACQLGE